jgi:hypothetical protein
MAGLLKRAKPARAGFVSFDRPQIAAWVYGLNPN